MPIPRDASVGKIVKIEMAAGKPRKQALAIAMRKKGKDRPAARPAPRSIPANKGREGGTRAAGSLPVTDSRSPRYGEPHRGMRVAQMRTSQREDMESIGAARGETSRLRHHNQGLQRRERIWSDREMDIQTRLDREKYESGIDRLKRERRERKSNSPGQA